MFTFRFSSLPAFSPDFLLNLATVLSLTDAFLLTLTYIACYRQPSFVRTSHSLHCCMVFNFRFTDDRHYIFTDLRREGIPVIRHVRPVPPLSLSSMSLFSRSWIRIFYQH